MSNLVNSLKARCAEAGTNITAVCEAAGVSRSTIERWKAKPPKSIQILNDLEKVIADAKLRQWQDQQGEPQFPANENEVVGDWEK